MSVAAPRGGRPGRVRPRASIPIALGLIVGTLLAACGGGGESSTPTLNWYINPDDGGQQKIADACSEASDGAYRIEIQTLPTDANGQREQLVRRLAANDSSIDIMSLDPVFVPEFANAGFLRPFTDEEAGPLTDGVLDGAVQTSTWDDQLVVAPFYANTQLLWYRKSVAGRAGLDLENQSVTWDQLVQAAEQTGTTIDVTGARYEGYMVWINSLVASAGGEIMEDPEAGRDATPTLDTDAGRRAAEIIRSVGRNVAAPDISTALEDDARNSFQSDTGGFMVNWPYVWRAANAAVEDGSLDQAVVDDIGWALLPEVNEGTGAAPPIGGINIGIGAFGNHQDLAVDAVRCITSEESQKAYFLSDGNPASRSAVFEDPEIREQFPMAPLIQQSIDEATPRPQSPYYTDISAATVREFHPPASVNPDSTPQAADDLIVNVLQDRQLL